MNVPYRQRPTRGIRAQACRVFGGIQRGPAEQLFKEGRGDPFGLADHGRGLGQVQHEVTLVELHQPAPRVRVRDRKLSRMIDPARALGQRGLEQVGAVGGEQERNIHVLAEPVHLVQQLEQQRVLAGVALPLLGD